MGKSVFYRKYHNFNGQRYFMCGDLTDERGGPISTPLGAIKTVCNFKGNFYLISFAKVTLCVF